MYRVEGSTNIVHVAGYSVVNRPLNHWKYTKSYRLIGYRSDTGQQIFACSVRPGYVNALGWKNRPCRPLHKETRRRIIDRYLTGEGPKAISTAARATPGAVYCIIRHHETFSTCEAFSQGGRSYPSKISDDVACRIY